MPGGFEEDRASSWTTREAGETDVAGPRDGQFDIRGFEGQGQQNAERDQVTDHSHTHLSPALPPGICILSGDVALPRSVSLESCLAAVEWD